MICNVHHDRNTNMSNILLDRLSTKLLIKEPRNIFYSIKDLFIGIEERH